MGSVAHPPRPEFLTFTGASGADGPYAFRSRLAALYDQLFAVMPSPVVELNRAVARYGLPVRD